MKKRLLLSGAIGAAAVVYGAYRRDIKAAKKRIENAQFFGGTEFAESGDGPAVLAIHGAGGGFDQGLFVARGFLGNGFRLIAPSRFGYLGTELPEDASPEAQADAYAELLDGLKLERVPVVAVSAGAPSAMQFALRHPERCSALVLIVPLAYPPSARTSGGRSALFNAVFGAISSSDFVFWAAMKLAHKTLVRMILGTPIEDYLTATAGERRGVDEMLRLILPISRRKDGLANENVIAETLEPYELDKLEIPALVISAADDLYGTYESSVYTAKQIHRGKLVAFPTGGHLLVGHEDEVRAQIMEFLKETAAVKAA